MQTKPEPELKWNILKRLQRLPYDQIGLIHWAVMYKSDCTQSKYYRVVQEKDNDVHVLIAIAEVLQCKVDDVINPDYEFQDPQLTKEQVNTMASKKESRLRVILSQDGQSV